MVTIFVSLENREAAEEVESAARSFGATPAISAPRGGNGKEVDVFFVDDARSAMSIAEQTRQTSIIIEYDKRFAREAAERVASTFPDRIFAVHWTDSIRLLQKVVEKKKG